jgi:hypothetical protein
MKNYMEQFKLSVVENAAVYTAAKTLDVVTDLKVLKSKLYDTSSSADAFSSLTAGDVIRMTGWEDYKTENNGIFKVTEVESSGEWIKVDIPLVDCTEDDIPTGGITMYHTPASWTVTGATEIGSKIMGALDLAADAAFSDSYFRVTAANTVSSFAEIEAGTATSEVVVFWADRTAG